MAREFRVRDPVHNFVYLWEPEVKLIGTRVFQRLRGIRQLALANLVYPGALHTRFDHSLGVCHVAGLLAEQLGLDQEETRLVRLAALLHDLGHGPFSHVSENILERYADTSALPPDQNKEEIHERVTCHLAGNDPEIVRILGKDTCDQVAKLLLEGHGQRALRSLVSGPLDADKQDYLLRDSLFCGVPYGVFDIHQLRRSLVLRGVEDDKELMIAADGIPAVEQYVLAKYYLTTNVYRHRVRLISDQMIVRAIVLGIEEDDLGELRELYTFNDSEKFYDGYATWDDSRFLTTFGTDESKGELCKELLQRLQRRQLHKLIFSENINAFSAPAVHDKLLKIGAKDSDALRQSIEQEIASLLVDRDYATIVDSRFLIVHGFDIKSVRTTARNEEGGILVARKTPRPFDDESTLFRSISQSYSDGFVEVYAPVCWKTRTERGKIKKALVEPIKGILESKCK